jgi:hypothetical protein
MKIQLKGDIHNELKTLGYKAGDIIEATVTNQPSKVAHFENHNYAVTQHCSVWPENYDTV